ncbi:MAG TPA: ABC-2 family transporter protein [Abditibacteriaceae bacterium]|jgi:ABC-2 type transport system permease protein
MMRYLNLYRSFVGNCLARTLEFRAQFFAGIFAYLVWNGVTLLFISAVFGSVGAVRGWTREEMWVLLGTCVMLESLCYGLIGPNMWRFSDSVRDGGLDLILTKPVSVQFFTSLRYLDFSGTMNVFAGGALLAYGLKQANISPSLGQWLLWFALLVCAFALAYSVWFFCVSWSIWAVKLESVAVIFDPMMQMARFPVQIYPARLQSLFTFVLPVAFLTTYPAQALLGRTGVATLGWAAFFAVTALFLLNKFFHFALRFYGSASS